MKPGFLYLFCYNVPPELKELVELKGGSCWLSQRDTAGRTPEVIAVHYGGYDRSARSGLDHLRKQMLKPDEGDKILEYSGLDTKPTGAIPEAVVRKEAALKFLRARMDRGRDAGSVRRSNRVRAAG